MIPENLKLVLTYIAAAVLLTVTIVGVVLNSQHHSEQFYADMRAHHAEAERVYITVEAELKSIREACDE